MPGVEGLSEGNGHTPKRPQRASPDGAGAVSLPGPSRQKTRMATVWWPSCKGEKEPDDDQGVYPGKGHAETQIGWQV
jgi:hypothetical protein